MLFCNLYQLSIEAELDYGREQLRYNLPVLSTLSITYSLYRCATDINILPEPSSLFAMQRFDLLLPDYTASNHFKSGGGDEISPAVKNASRRREGP